MTDDPVHHGRRRFLTDFLRDAVVEPVAQEREKEQELQRRELAEDAYELGLRAWGPDLVAGTAKGLGVAAEDADYKTLAKALADGELDGDDEIGDDENSESDENSEGDDERV